MSSNVSTTSEPLDTKGQWHMIFILAVSNHANETDFKYLMQKFLEFIICGFFYFRTYR